MTYRIQIKYIEAREFYQLIDKVNKYIEDHYNEDVDVQYVYGEKKYYAAIKYKEYC